MRNHNLRFGSHRWPQPGNAEGASRDIAGADETCLLEAEKINWISGVLSERKWWKYGVIISSLLIPVTTYFPQLSLLPRT